MSNNEGESKFSLPVRVYYEDTDIGGTVYHANFLKFMERARIEWLHSLGFELDALRLDAEVVFAVRYAEIAYLLLTVTVALGGHSGASLDLVHEVRCEADAILYCRGRIKVVCVSARTLRPKRIPERLLAEIADVC